MTDDKVGRYLAFDPGTTTGMAMFNAGGDVVRVGQYSLDQLGEFFDELTDPIEQIIYEEFKVFKHKTSAFANNKMVVSQAVGIIVDNARRRRITPVVQPPYIKTTAEKLTGQRVAGNHNNSHFQDAFLHGAYYLIKQGIRESELKRKQREKGLNNARSD